MSNQRGVGPFCSIVVATLTGTSNSLAALGGGILGEGAEAFCLQNKKSYRYTSTVITQALPVYVAAAGTGTWVEQIAVADATAAIVGSANFAFPTVVTPPTTQWQALPSVTSGYQASLSGSLWSLNTTTGVLTYNGPSGVIFLVTGILSWNPNFVPSGGAVLQWDITSNGANIGFTTPTLTQTLSSSTTDTTSPQQVVSQFITGASHGDTFQHIYKVSPAAVDYVFLNYQATFTPLL